MAVASSSQGQPSWLQLSCSGPGGMGPGHPSQAEPFQHHQEVFSYSTQLTHTQLDKHSTRLCHRQSCLLSSRPGQAARKQRSTAPCKTPKLLHQGSTKRGGEGEEGVGTAAFRGRVCEVPRKETWGSGTKKDAKIMHMFLLCLPGVSSFASQIIPVLH